MQKTINFYTKKEIVLDFIYFFLCFVSIGFGILLLMIIDIFLVKIEAIFIITSCSGCFISIIIEFCMHLKNKIVINYNEEKISLFLKLKVRREKFFIDINLNFSEIEQIEIIEIENENFYDFKIITSTSEEYIALKSILKNWKIQRRERLAKEILIELETLAKAIKETKQI